MGEAQTDADDAQVRALQAEEARARGEDKYRADLAARARNEVARARRIWMGLGDPGPIKGG